MTEPLLSIHDLSVAFVVGERRVQAVTNVSFDLVEGARVGIIGESGSGKTVTALSLLKLHDSRRVEYGPESRIMYQGEDVLSLSSKRLRRIRGAQIAMIFQNPMTSLNPTFTIGSQIQRVVRVHHDISAAEARERTVAALGEVELPAPEKQLRRYPNELSGGQRQRALIAMALACEPRIIIADEPTSGLDVTVQAGILEMLLERTVDRGISVLMITHDMGVISRFCDEINVMYGGTIVESGPVTEIFRQPRHPYTSGLLRSIPDLTRDRLERLYSIPGRQEERTGIRQSCVFADRCSYQKPKCWAELPPLTELDPEHRTACIRHSEITLAGARADPRPSIQEMP